MNGYLLVDVVEGFVANFTPDRRVNVVAISESAVEIADQTYSSSATCAHSSSAMVEVALGSLKNPNKNSGFVKSIKSMSTKRSTHFERLLVISIAVIAERRN